jgi:uncharacterized protein YaeQ
MALPSTIHKLTLSIANMDKGYYADHALTLARHPSETEERLMARVLAFALWPSESLAAGRGLSVVEDPDWQDADLTGRITRWIDVGLADLRRVKKALSQADTVCLLAYGDRPTDMWWQKEGPSLKTVTGQGPRERDRLQIVRLSFEDGAALTALCARTMSLQVMVQDGDYTITGEHGAISVRPVRLHPVE